MTFCLWKGVLFSVSLYLSCFFGCTVILMPLLIFALQYPTTGRHLMDFFFMLWFTFAAAIYELLYGIKIVINGHPSPTKHSILILCNHPTRLDWLFLVSYILRCGSLSQYRISLKHSLKHIPGPGWAMQCAGFLFLQRDWKHDYSWITQSVKYLSRVGCRPQFLLFPEGTDFCEKSVRRSREYALSNGLPVYRHVLHPHTAGFVHFVTTMKQEGILDSILDVTVAYPKDEAIHTELEFAQGKHPSEVHFHITDYSVDTLPSTADRLGTWCRDRWQEKEERLVRFGETQTFAVDSKPSPVSPTKQHSVQLLLWSVILFWTLFLTLVFYCLVCFPLFKWYCLASSIIFMLIGVIHGGIDCLLYSSVT